MPNQLISSIVNCRMSYPASALISTEIGCCVPCSSRDHISIYRQRRPDPVANKSPEPNFSFAVTLSEIV
ncbi:Uncharacterized protein HZ326_20660 [Fusarium oxysporum f. sp. albedinis]|nr:Uncharacterized protein HZ326_20660 [Fusarium oxysporum f. sp. albedinis]